MKKSMRKIGITGGVGSGKSRVLTFLEEECGARVCQADLLAHQVQEPGTDCFAQVTAQFGTGIIGADGRIDRTRLGQLVFSDKDRLEKLNAIVHPAVNREICRLMEEEEKRGTGLFVLEAALLTGKIYRDMLDEIWYIYAVEAVRRVRLEESRGYTAEKTNAMLSSQVSEDVYRSVCDRVIDNSGPFEATEEQIKTALREESDRRVDS